MADVTVWKKTVLSPYSLQTQISNKSLNIYTMSLGVDGDMFKLVSDLDEKMNNNSI